MPEMAQIQALRALIKRAAHSAAAATLRLEFVRVGVEQAGDDGWHGRLRGGGALRK